MQQELKTIPLWPSVFVSVFSVIESSVTSNPTAGHRGLHGVRCHDGAPHQRVKVPPSTRSFGDDDLPTCTVYVPAGVTHRLVVVLHTLSG
jgi:hypothetical protein